MHPETRLAFVAAFGGFLLKTSLGFCICWAMAKAAVRPHSRFLIWLVFLVAAASCWLWVLASLVPHTALPTSSIIAAQLPASSPLGTLHVTTFWLAPLSFVPRLLGTIYFAVLAYLLFSRVKKHLHLRWILRFTFEPPPEVETLFRPVAGTLGFPNVRLLMLFGIDSPATFGWINSIILMPPLCPDQDQAELLDIFRHELHHIRRRDVIFNSLASLCRALLFFHPAAWHAMRSLSLQSELACDFAVIGNSPERRASYAECLVRFARQRVAREPAPWNLDFAGSSNQLELRIRSMLAGDRTLPAWLLAVRAACGAALLLAFLAAAPSLFIVLSYQQPPAAPTAALSVSASAIPVRAHGRGIRPDFRARPGRRNPVIPVGSSADHSGESGANLSPSNPTEAAVSADTTRRLSLSNSCDPVLSRRDETPAKSRPPASAGTILLSTPAESGSDSLTRRASAASIIAAGAGEVAHVASHRRDKN